MSVNKLIFGNIVTMNEKQPVAEAMVVQDDKIKFVGTKDDAKSFAGSNAEILDFGSKTIYPGFIDVHSHIGLLSTMMGGAADFAYGDSYEDNIRDMTEYIKANPEKEIYKGFAFTADAERGFPTHEMLDAIEIDGEKVDKPIVIPDWNGHLSWYNKIAMDKFGINKDMAKKYGEDVVPCDANGEPIGCLKETPHYAVLGAIPLEKEEVKEIFMGTQEQHMAHGFSMVGDCGINEGANPMVSAMGELAQEGKLKLKVRAYYQIFETCEEPLKEIDKALEFAKKYNCDRFKIIGIKIFLDGVNGGMSAWTLEPYKHYKFNGQPYSGYKRWTYERIDELAEIIRKANVNGLSVQLHAIGNGAARYALDVIEKAQSGISNPDFRNAVSHLYCVDKEDIPRFAKLNVMPVVAPQWYVLVPAEIDGEKIIYGDPEIDKDLEDNGYLEMGALQSYLDTGANPAFHTDGAPDDEASRMFFNAVNKYDPIMDPNMKPRNIDEKMSAYDSVKCMTSNSAYVMKEEDKVGTLEVGKQADFVIYDVDFMDEKVITNPDNCGILPKSLYINGEKMF